MAKQKSRAKAEKSESVVKPRNVEQQTHTQLNANLLHCYTLPEVRQMEIADVLDLFTNFEVFNKLLRKYKLRCHFIEDKCCYLYSGRSVKECKTAMQTHLQNHIDNYAAKLARNPKFYGKMRFRSCVTTDAGQAVENEIDQGEAIKSVTVISKDSDLKSATPYQLTLSPVKLLNSSDDVPHSVTLTSPERDNIFAILSRDLLPTVVMDKIDVTPEKKEQTNVIHDAYDCHCDNDGNEICRSKQALLSTLRLERIRLAPDETSSQSSTVSSVHCSPKLLRTRLQRKKAILERIHRKQQAAITPCRLRKRLTSLSRHTSPLGKNRTPMKQARRRNVPQRSPRNRLLIRLREAAMNAHVRDGTLLSRKGYNLRRAKLLERNAKFASKSHSPPKKEEVYNPVGEVVRMPIESMMELLEEERRLSEQQETEEQPSHEKAYVHPKKVVPPRRMNSSKPVRRSHSHQSTQSDRRNNASHKNLPHAGGSSQRDAPKNNRKGRASVVKIDGKLIPIKMELPEEDPSITADFFGMDAGEGSSAEPSVKKQKMTVSSLLFQRRRCAARRRNTSTDIEKSSGSDGDVIKNSEDDGSSDLDVIDAARDSGDAVYLSDSNSSDNEKLRLPPTPSKMGSATSTYSAMQTTSSTGSKNTTEQTDVNRGKGKDTKRKVVESKGKKGFPKKLKQKLEEIKREINAMPPPTLTQEEYSLLGLFNDHTYVWKEVDCVRKIDNILSKIRVDDYEDETQIISKLTDEERTTRQKALIFLRQIRNRNKDMLITSDWMMKEGNELICKICNKRFAAPNSLYYHYRSHAGVKPYKCDICHKTFTRLHSLNYHVMIHTNSTRFKCRYCDRGFRHPSHFKEHLNKHTGEEPYECTLCGRRFKTSNTHRRHMTSKHRTYPSAKNSTRILPAAMRGSKYDTAGPAHADKGLALRSKSPPLPDSPPPSILPIKPFQFQHQGPVRLILFPKNGIFRYTEL